MKKVTILISLLLITSCDMMKLKSDTKFASNESDIAAKRFKTQNSRASLYIFTDDIVISMIRINGRKIGELQNDSFFNLQLPPDIYTISMEGLRFENKNKRLKIKIKLLANTNHFVELETHPGPPPYGTLTEVSDMDGKKGVNENRLLVHKNF
jgi:hypothetical protein